jgi:chaperone modulatory protein CbpM
MSSKMPTEVSGFLYTSETLLTIDEFSRVCAVERRQIIELVEEGVLVPVGSQRTEWRLPGDSLRRAQAAVRLQRDLGVNLAGVALALELMDELERLRSLFGTDPFGRVGRMF